MNTDESISGQVATEAVAIFCNSCGHVISEEQYFQISDYFKKWILKEGLKKDTLIRRQAALKRACFSIGPRELSTSKEVIAFAEKLYSYF